MALSKAACQSLSSSQEADVELGRNYGYPENNEEVHVPRVYGRRLDLVWGVGEMFLGEKMFQLTPK